MTPTSGPCGPVERGFVERTPRLDTEQFAASVGSLCQSYLSRLAELLNSKLAVSGMPLGDHSGQSSQPFWQGVRGRSSRSLFKAQWSLSGP